MLFIRKTSLFFTSVFFGTTHILNITSVRDFQLTSVVAKGGAGWPAPPPPNNCGEIERKSSNR